MSLLDQKALLKSVQPFDLLSDRTIENLMRKMDIAYYPKETILIAPRVRADSLYIVIKGFVNETIEGELQNVYGPNDSFDANALIYGNTQSTFCVAEDLICYEFSKETFLNLLQDETSFEHYFMQDFITKHQRLKERQNQNILTPFMMSKVDDIYLHEACFVNGNESIRSSLLKMQMQNAKVILVHENDETGIVTDTDLRQKVLMEERSLDEAIGTIATKGLFTIERSDFLFNALLLFTKYGVKRLVVVENERIVGILEQLDLLSHFASHTHLIATSIDRAKSVEELESVQRSLTYLITSLTSKGVRVRHLSKLVSELHEKIYRKVFEMIVPSHLHSHCALIIMGSEGRGEQVMRTDQDNGLIIDTEENVKEFLPYMETVTDTLVKLGFPKCPGNVMVSNPLWTRSVSGYKKAISEWIESMQEDSLMALCIFMDAKVVAGDSNLLYVCKKYLWDHFVGRNDVMAHLGKGALAFETPLTFFSGFVLGKSGHESQLDIKKGGIFAIVHGVRILALEYKIETTNTIMRIKELYHAGVFDKAFSSELIETYDTLLSIRLRMILQDPSDLGIYINPKNLSKTEKDLLKDAFKIVNRFKKFLIYHYHLEIVM